LNPGKLLRLLKTSREQGNDMVNLFVPYDIFRDSKNESTGILEFLESFPVEVISKSDYIFGIPSETEEDIKSGLQTELSGEISGKNLELFYASCGELQKNAFEQLYSNSETIDKCNDHLINKDWLYLQSCDHFYFMNPVLYEGIDSNRILPPYDSHYFAYINYKNILMDFSYRLGNWFGDFDKNQKCYNGKITKVDKDIRDSIYSGRIKN